MDDNTEGKREEGGAPTELQSSLPLPLSPSLCVSMTMMMIPHLVW